jgi:hypothetical protein
MSIKNMSASAFAALSPEAKEARIAEQWATEKAANLIEWRSKNPEKVAEFAKKAREITAQWLEDRRIMKETNLEAFVAMVKNEAPGSQDPSRHTYLEERKLTTDFMRDQAIAERTAKVEKERAEKDAARDAERAAKEAARQAAYAAKLAERNKK